MKRIAWLVFVALLAASASSHLQAAAAGDLVWRGWSEGLRQAGSSKRPVLVDVYTQWCGWCRVMDNKVYARSDVREYLSRRFVTIKLDAESADPAPYEGNAYTSRSLAQRFRVTGFPTTVFLRSNGEHLVNVPGYVPPDRFLLLLRYIGDGHFDRQVPFDEFVKSAEGARPPAR